MGRLRMGLYRRMQLISRGNQPRAQILIYGPTQRDFRALTDREQKEKESIN